MQLQTMPVTKYEDMLLGFSLHPPTSVRPQRNERRQQTLVLMRPTHPVRPVQRGWRGLAGVRSTWPPPLTARCRRSQVSSVLRLLLANAPIGCSVYSTAPSTAPIYPQGRCSDSRCLAESVEKKKDKTYCTLVRTSEDFHQELRACWETSE